MKTEARLVHNEVLTAIAEAAEKGFKVRGATGMFEGQLDQQKKAYALGKLSPFFVAESYSLQGNTQEALKYLQVCYDRHADEAVNLAIDSAFNNLHSVPEFQQLLAKVGLPEVK